MNKWIHEIRSGISEWGIPRTGYFIPVRDTLWDLPGWESCWDAAAAVAVGVTWYQYYQYAHFSDITIHPKFKSRFSGGKKAPAGGHQADKAYIYHNTIRCLCPENKGVYIQKIRAFVSSLHMMEFVIYREKMKNCVFTKSWDLTDFYKSKPSFRWNIKWSHGHYEHFHKSRFIKLYAKDIT